MFRLTINQQHVDAMTAIDAAEAHYQQWGVRPPLELAKDRLVEATRSAISLNRYESQDQAMVACRFFNDRAPWAYVFAVPAE